MPWKRLKTDVEAASCEWLPEWNVPPAQRKISRPYCSVHWIDGANRAFLEGDRVLKREVTSQWHHSVIYLLERNGKIVARSEQVLWKVTQ